MYEDDNIIDLTDENEDNQKSDIDEVREKYMNKRSQKADEIIALQAVICIILVTGFFAANIFYPQECHEIYSIFESLIKNNQYPVPFISDYI